MDEIKTHEIFLAVLIDADNISYTNITALMEEVNKYGIATVKRVYGDWTSPQLAAWKNALQDYAITPIQQFSYTTGKNATDSALIIDAMDLLYSKSLDGFCLVSSDSDFTRLATRLREAGKFVYGFGEKKTPNAFIAACDRFFYLEVLKREERRKLAGQKNSVPKPERQRKKKEENPFDDKFLDFVFDAIEDLADETGWVFLADIGNLLMRKDPSFDPRNYGFKKLTPLIREVPGLEIEDRPTNKSNIRHIYVRIND